MSLNPGFGHILRAKDVTQTTLNTHMALSTMLCEGTQNYSRKQQLLKDKFTALAQNNQPIVSGGGGVDGHMQGSTQVS